MLPSKNLPSNSAAANLVWHLTAMWLMASDISTKKSKEDISGWINNACIYRMYYYGLIYSVHLVYIYKIINININAYTIFHQLKVGSCYKLPPDIIRFFWGLLCLILHLHRLKCQNVWPKKSPAKSQGTCQKDLFFTILQLAFLAAHKWWDWPNTEKGGKIGERWWVDMDRLTILIAFFVLNKCRANFKSQSH